VPNEHDDIERFRADIIAAFEEMFGLERRAKCRSMEG
jgi:hypothetical protein